ncbi:MAG: HAMP domain-containing sensor histidine kinase [Sneathiella sp.]
MTKFTLLGTGDPPSLSNDDREAFAGKVASFVKFKQKYSLLPRISQVLSIILCMALLGQQVESGDVVCWGAFMFAAAIAHIALYFIFPSSKHTSSTVHWITVLENIAQGLIAAGFGYVSIFLWPTTTIGEIGIICFLTIYLGNTAENSVGYFRLGILFAGLILIPLIYRLFFLPSHIGIVAGIFECFVFIYMCWRVNALACKVTEKILQKIENNKKLVTAVEQNELNLKAHRSNTDLLAAASHDLRQPIHAIRLFISNSEFLDPKDKVGRDENKENINLAFQCMEGMLDSLLNISYLNSDKSKLTTDSIEIGALLERVSNELKVLAAENSGTVRLVKSSLCVDSNALWLDRLLRNLIGNAVKYSPGGRILVGVRRKGTFARIQILDTGSGIPDTEVALIFDEFRSFKRKGVKAQGSLGLGLAIVSRISKLLDLEVSVTSEVGRGTVFSVDVPLIASELNIDDRELELQPAV